MPLQTRWYLKTSLVYLVAALAVALVIAVQPLTPVAPVVNVITPVYFHLFLVGWVTQLIFGIVFWMFPKYSRLKPRGSERIGWATYGLLNVGLLLRVFSEPANALHPAPAWGWALVLSALLQWLAAVLFVGNTWGRVKEK